MGHGSMICKPWPSRSRARKSFEKPTIFSDRFALLGGAQVLIIMNRQLAIYYAAHTLTLLCGPSCRPRIGESAAFR